MDIFMKPIYWNTHAEPLIYKMIEDYMRGPN